MNAEPSAKTGYTVLAGAAVSILVWVVTTVAHIDIPAEIAAAATTLITGAIAILVPAKSGTYITTNPDVDRDWDPAVHGSMSDFADEEEEA